MQVLIMHKIKLLSQRPGVEIKVEGLMIKLNLMTSHNQKVDLSLRRWENAPIVGKMATSKEIIWHWNKEQTEDKDEMNDTEKNAAVVMIDDDVVMLFLE